jgi:hypothetical protein
MAMSEERLQAVREFTLAAWVLLAVDLAILLLSLAGSHWAHMRYAAMVFLAVLRLPGTGLVGVVLNPQALFSPVTTSVLMSFWPAWAQLGCLALAFPALRGVRVPAKLGYLALSLVPALGPAAAAWLMKRKPALPAA